MKRIRLQVIVLPWEDNGSPHPSTTQPRQETLRPWLQVCTEEMSLQDLADQIARKFSSIYAGRGTLRIKHLESDFGDILDLSDTVGDVFDDRAPSGESRTSIVKVARYPPNPGELRTPTRFGSLMPESSARPKKRPLEYSPPEPQRNRLPPLPTVEDWGLQRRSVSVQMAHKRPRVQETTFHGDFEFGPGEIRPEFSNSSLQLGREQEPVQVYDSQDLRPEEQQTPYGTPLSLSLNGRAPQHGFEVPSSPNNSREQAIDLDRQSPKSESPELGPSVHHTPPHKPELEKKAMFQSAGLPAPLASDVSNEDQHQSLLEDHASSSFQFSSPQMLPPPKPESSQESAFPQTTSSMFLVKATKLNKFGKNTRISEDVFDPIESDTESLVEKQGMHSTKRLKLSKALNNGGHVPSTSEQHLSHSRQSKTLTYSPTTSHAMQGLTTEDSGLEKQNSLSANDKSAAVRLDGRHDQTTILPQTMGPPFMKRKTPMSPAPPISKASKSLKANHTVRSDPTTVKESSMSGEAALPSDHEVGAVGAKRSERGSTMQPETTHDEQAIATGRQLGAQKAAKEISNTLDLDVDVDGSNAGSPSHVGNTSRSRKAKKKDREKSTRKTTKQELLAKVREEASKAGEDHNKEECTAEKRARRASSAIRKTAAEHEEGTRAAKEERARAENTKDESKANRRGTIDDEENRQTRAASLEGRHSAETVLAKKRAERERLRREEELAREGEKMMSAAEGARQLEAEKAKTLKQVPPKSKTPKTPRNESSTPTDTKFPSRTEEQKQRRRDREAKKKAEGLERALNDAKRAFERAQSMPSSSAAFSPSPVSSRSSAAPPRSILKNSGTGSTMRRSLSYNEAVEKSPESTKFNVPEAPITNHGTAPMKSLRDINSSLAPKTFVTLKPPHDAQFSKSPAGRIASVQKNGVSTDIKMTGKAVDPPALAANTEAEELVLSSDDGEDKTSISTWYSDDERKGEDGTPKASPTSQSAEKPASRNAKLPVHKSAPIQVTTNVNPGLHNEINRTDETSTTRSTRSRSTASSSTSEKQSASRSPARQRSPSRSSSSESNDESEESSDSDSSSEEEESLTPKRRTDSSGDSVVSQDGIEQSDTTSKASCASAQVPVANGAQSALSQTSQDNLDQQPRNTSPTIASNTDIDEAVNAQIRTEIRASLSPAKTRKDNPTLATKQTHQGQNPNLQPTNNNQANKKAKPPSYRYPKLSVMKAAREDLPPPSSGLESSAVGSQQPKSFDSEDDLSSDSDDSDSDSDSDGNKKSDSPKDKSSVTKGMKKLIKLSTGFGTTRK